MQVKTILAATQRATTITESYSGYLTKIVTTLKNPTSAASVKPQTLDQVAHIVTALSIVANEKFRATLKLSDSDVVNLLTTLGTATATTNKLIDISKKSPSQLTAMVTLLADYTKLDESKQQELIVQLTNLNTKLQTIYTTMEKTATADNAEIEKASNTTVPKLT